MRYTFVVLENSLYSIICCSKWSEHLFCHCIFPLLFLINGLQEHQGSIPVRSWRFRQREKKSVRLLFCLICADCGAANPFNTLGRTEDRVGRWGWGKEQYRRKKVLISLPPSHSACWLFLYKKLTPTLFCLAYLSRWSAYEEVGYTQEACLETCVWEW